MTPRPRIGFLGTGWIGRHRLEAMVAADCIEVAAVADPSDEMRAAAIACAPDAAPLGSFDELLAMDLDGVVIASPSALHADQSIAALERGLAVFCQKPLGRTAAEVRKVVDAARSADRLLGVDLSYRFTAGMTAIRELVRSGELGQVFAADLTFHNAYGPDKSWFYDPALSGGGCVMDLGVHLVDLALWTLDFPRVQEVRSSLYAGGKAIANASAQVEDYAVATVSLENGTTVRIACSWNLPAGREAEIAATFYGTNGGAALRNIDGSFLDFQAHRLIGTRSEELAPTENEWGGRAAVDWARRLAEGARFDPEAERLVEVSAVLDRIYGRAASAS